MLSDDEHYNNDYVIGVATLWNKTIYGEDARYNTKLETNWFLYDTLTIDEFYEEECNWLHHYTAVMKEYVVLYNSHLNSVLRNFATIISNPQIDILKIEYLNSHHIIVTKKTIWLKIIQRMWKKIYNRQKLKRSIHMLFRRQLIGK